MSIKKNFLYSLVLTTSNYIFPLLVYPYISRVLGVTGIGLCNFVDSIINYFVLFSTIGISIIGIREIASCKNRHDDLNVVFTSLIAHTIIPTIIVSVIFCFSVIFIEKLYEYKELFFIGLGKIIGTAFLLDWFYKGIEDFKYITKRTIIIKTLYVASVFLFIKGTNDYVLYFALTTLMVLVNSLINVLYCKKFIDLKFDVSVFKKMLKPNLINGFYLFLNTMYSTLNVAFLGFVSSIEEVGYYTTATKIFSIILAIYTAFTGVMLPRMSYLFSEHKIKEFKELIIKSLNILIMFSIPIVIFSMILAPQIINIISGDGFEGAYIPAIISMPLIFVVGYEQILVIQIITPLKEDVIKLKNSIVGALVGIIGNIILVSYFHAIGAALVWALSETAVLISAQYYVTKLTGLRFPIFQLVKEIFIYSPLILVFIFIQMISNSDVFTLGISCIILILYFLLIKLCLLKDSFLLGIINNFCK